MVDVEYQTSVVYEYILTCIVSHCQWLWVATLRSLPNASQFLYGEIFHETSYYVRSYVCALHRFKIKLLRAQKQSYDQISSIVYYCIGRSIRPLVAYQTSQDFSTVHISTNVIYSESLYIVLVHRYNFYSELYFIIILLHFLSFRENAHFQPCLASPCECSRSFRLHCCVCTRLHSVYLFMCISTSNFSI